MALNLFKPILYPSNSLSSSLSTQKRPNHLRFRVSASSAVATSSPTMYELLSIPKTAGPDEIKAAYRREARRWHPDTCHSSSGQCEFAERFMQVKEAYEILSDPSRRSGYDMSLLFGGEDSWRVMDERDGFGDWERQLERLQRRETAEDTWAARMRHARGWN